MVDGGVFSPPENRPATEVPLEYPVVASSVAADNDGTVYLTSLSGILLLDPEDGSLEEVVGPGEREVPDAPFADEAPAAEFGGSWEYRMDADDGVLVAVDGSLSTVVRDGSAFDWKGDFSDRAQEVVERIMRGEEHDRTSSTYHREVAVVVADGVAGTAMAHVSHVAVDDGALYAVGTTGSGSINGEALVVRMDLSAHR